MTHANLLSQGLWLMLHMLDHVQAALMMWMMLWVSMLWMLCFTGLMLSRLY